MSRWRSALYTHSLIDIAVGNDGDLLRWGPLGGPASLVLPTCSIGGAHVHANASKDSGLARPGAEGV